jgi:Holliday junction resolvase RusA-like endonuclease
MKNKQELTIYGSFPSLNKVISTAKNHWSQYAKLKKELTLSVAVQAMGAGLKPVDKAMVSFSWFLKDKRMDVDNVSHGQKYILDGLVEAHIIPTDGQKHISVLEHSFDVDRDNPRVVVQITELS